MRIESMFLMELLRGSVLTTCQNSIKPVALSLFCEFCSNTSTTPKHPYHFDAGTGQAKLERVQ